jgi:hypothetical protein
VLIIGLGIVLAVLIFSFWEYLTALNILGIVVGSLALAAAVIFTYGGVNWGIVGHKLVTLLAGTILAGFMGSFIGQLLHACLLCMQWDRGFSERFFEVYATVLVCLAFYLKLEEILEMMA